MLEDATGSKTLTNRNLLSFDVEAQRTERGSSGGKQKLPSWVGSALAKTVAIHGYPVLRRPMDCPGIEIPADILLRSVGSFNVITSPTNLALVGTRKTVVLVKEAEDVMVWHEAQNSSSLVCQCSSISLNCGRERGPWIDMDKLKLSRHVIGSCGRMEELQGKYPSLIFYPLKTKETLFTRNNVDTKIHMPTTSIPEREQSIDFDLTSAHTNFGKTPNSLGMVTFPVNELWEYHASPVAGCTSLDAIALPFTRQVHLEDAGHNSGGTTDSSLDSDFLSMSDSSTEFEPCGLDSRLPIIRKAAEKLLIQYRLVHSAGNSTGSSCKKGSQTSTSVPSSASQQSQHLTGLQQESRKRKSQQIDDRDESDEERPAQRPSKNPRLQSPKYLACPFWKFESSAHHSCFSLKLNRIRDVKQHLSRKHTPAYYCDRCSTIFKTENQLREHVSNATGLFCNPCATLEGVSRGQRLQLSRKSDKSLSEEGQWFAIWDIVFPQHKRPMSAYLEPEIVEDVYLFQ